jgi:hypothetical protein
MLGWLIWPGIGNANKLLVCPVLNMLVCWAEGCRLNIEGARWGVVERSELGVLSQGVNIFGCGFDAVKPG